MYAYRLVASCLLAWSSIASAVPSLAERDDACTNTPTTRSCWSPGFSASTQTDDKFPDTGKTVRVNLQVGEATLSPDGTPRKMMVFNGQYPGPPIVADWGDTLEITVTNNLPLNGTSIHWHGLRQLHSNQMDGTNGLTECPIAPGQTKVYTFKATAYGTSWYHSHYSIQYGDGLVGPLIINGPATANYDIDLGAVAISDWYQKTMFEILSAHVLAPPTSQSLLVNGKGGSDLSRIKFTPGKKHRLRLINVGINNNMHVGIDQHKMTVIQTDFVAVQPYTADTLSIAVGQRYDVIVEANQNVANYHLRVGTGGGKCDGPNAQQTAGNNKGAIITYEGAGDAAPSSTPLTLPVGCVDEQNVVPFVQTTVPAPTGNPISLFLTLDTSAGVFWKVNGQAQDIDWNTPTLSYVINGTFNLPPNDNAITVDSAGWVYLLVANDTPVPHPIHLHGHDFWILADGVGTGADAKLNLNNPTRRDTHTVAGNNGTPGKGGYSVLAFKADNPGAWLLHCHIPFHISGGLGVQFLERPAEIVGSLGDLGGFKNGCETWNKLKGTTSAILQPDSGLKVRRRTVRH